ncbi:flagellar basal body P-ring protein FlgI [Parvibaculum sp.]|uniref:flagellar basal body P-ring protein FlgI n=1 Tax=Parvibaculum sp. TaxID=2024848 RepID=UPI00272FD181|nr:flagellar basal body P-ring protein FlgI [Parvibaculum sp.]MDP1627103.1 flagellar basal body P-ring protein FlgI [Parvibaculum sp.]MDP2149306.1 flagellar basal body P-ring protein FlgI [Parvibaculum sp.]MDP3328124.1 flagellar basal body P-ring protein FlgI [Parvibaculum sp.]
MSRLIALHFRSFLTLALACLLAALDPAGAQASSRIKDIVDVEGIRDNMLVGYGLVVGLNGTGDTLRNAPFTQQSLIGMLERLGVNTRGTSLKTANVAAVMVSANLPAFAAQGTHIDVTVSALGDATNLQGGVLLVTPLMGADGQVYAVAQGSLATGGFAAQGEAASVVRGVPTNGRIANGAIVERELDFRLSDLRSLRLSLRNPDLTTAQRVASAINAFIGTRTAIADNPTTVQLTVPPAYNGGVVALLTDIEQLRVQPDLAARVVIDEASGVIVMGQDVRVSKVAIAQGNLTISVSETPQVSQPSPFSTQGDTVVVPRTDIKVDEEQGKKLGIIDGSISLKELVDGLNALGVSPRDMITILQAIKSSGALQAEIEVM